MALFGLFNKKEEKKEELIPDTAQGHFEKMLGWQELEMAGGAKMKLTPDSGYTAFPKPEGTLRLIYESENKFIEESYYWLVNYMRYSGQARMPEVKKVLDTFQGSIQSSGFGQQAQRQAIQQDRASQYLRAISEMTKQLHQLIRELRIIDERMSFYDETFKRKDAESADIALKGLWVDMVEGGAKNPASVYGMQQNLSFATLPDLFFATRVKDEGTQGLKGEMSIVEYNNKTGKLLKQIDPVVDKLEFNNKVKEVLKRKLYQFYTWKYRTYRELYQRRKFSIKYLRQHYNTIRLYAEWVKPYLQNVARLSGNQRAHNQPELVSGFESSVLELELLAKAKDKPAVGSYFGVVSIHLRFVTTPQFSHTTPDFQNRGPQHSGRMEITYRSYGFTERELKLYGEMRHHEALEYVKDYDGAIGSMLDEVSKDLAEYLKEAGEDMETPREREIREAKAAKADEQNSMGNPFFLVTDTWAGFKELFGSLGFQDVLKTEKADATEEELKKSRKKAAATSFKQLYKAYNLYKKSHRFMTP